MQPLRECVDNSTNCYEEKKQIGIGASERLGGRLLYLPPFRVSRTINTVVYVELQIHVVSTAYLFCKNHLLFWWYYNDHLEVNLV